MNRSYQRELMKSHKLSLIKKFKSLLASGSNVLTPYHRKRLLGKKRKERGGMTDSDLWYRIKPRCKTGIQDLLLISEIANEEILKEIFFTRDERTGNIPINELFELLFPQDTKEISKEEKWRIELLEEIVCKGLEWYLKKGVFKTKSHQRMIFETLDAITIVSSGKEIYKETTESHFIDKVRF